MIIISVNTYSNNTPIKYVVCFISILPGMRYIYRDFWLIHDKGILSNQPS